MENLSGLYERRGTMLIGAANLSPVTKPIASTGAVSRYKLDRSQEFIKVQNLNCVQRSVSRVEQRIKSRIESSSYKNRDKQMPFIVRVSKCAVTSHGCRIYHESTISVFLMSVVTFI